MALFQLQNSRLQVKVNSFGAELCSVFSTKTNIEYIWQADESLWQRHAPNLFPIVGKLKEGKFEYNSQSYHLPQHGFARDTEFVCIEQSENTLIFELTASENTLVNYPFHFSLQVKYELNDSLLTTAYSVFNPDGSDLYFSVGAHPAFNCPLLNSESFTDYELIFPKKNELEINLLNDGLISDKTKTIQLNNETLNVSKHLFENDALVLMNNQINEVSLRSVKSAHGVTLISHNWPYFGIWAKKNSEKFVCLEPWYGIADSDNSDGDFTKKQGIIKLASEQNFQCSFDLVFF